MGKFHGETRKAPPLREYAVVELDGTEHTILAHFGFDNSDEGKGLVFRRYRDDDRDNFTYVVAAFAQGSYKFWKEIYNGE